MIKKTLFINLFLALIFTGCLSDRQVQQSGVDLV